MCGVMLGAVCVLVVYFFKQKTEYEIRLSRVGSEMGIRDRAGRVCSGDMVENPSL